MSALEETLALRCGETELTLLELIQIGEAVLNSIGTTVTLGWASPAGSLDYSRLTGSFGGDIVRDFVAWTSGRNARSPGCQEALKEFIDKVGWRRHQIGLQAKSFGLLERNAA